MIITKHIAKDILAKWNILISSTINFIIDACAFALWYLILVIARNNASSYNYTFMQEYYLLIKEKPQRSRYLHKFIPI